MITSIQRYNQQSLFPSVSYPIIIQQRSFSLSPSSISHEFRLISSPPNLVLVILRFPPYCPETSSIFYQNHSRYLLLIILPIVQHVCHHRTCFCYLYRGSFYMFFYYSFEEMQGTSLSDFLEVSINTDKFNSFASSLAASLAAHERQIQQHTKELAHLRLHFEEKLARVAGELEFEKDRLDKKRKEDFDFFNGFILDINKKHDSQVQTSKSRIGELERRFTQEGGRAQIQLIASIKQQMKDQMAKQANTWQQELAVVESQIKNIDQQFKKNLSTQDFILKNVLDAYEGKGRNHNKENEQGQHKEMMSRSKSRPQSKRLTRESYFAKEGKDRNNPLEQATIQEGRQRRRRKDQDKCEQQNLQYASISAKLDSLQNRLTAKQNQGINKVLYPQKNVHVNTEPSQQAIPLSMERIQLQRKNLQTNITSKLEHIEEIIGQKFSNCEKEAERLKSKYQLLSDEFQIMGRKFEKEKNKIADISTQMKKVDERRVDDKLIDNLVVMMKRQNGCLEEQIQRKVGREAWEKDKTRVHERLQIISEGLAEKADKDQIKRAFVFIQDKIKEIVLLMADDAQQQKEGAGRKLPFKCLSCDKDLQHSLPTTTRPLPSRCSSSNLRKRVRAGPLDSR